MNWAITRNNRPVERSKIPGLTPGQLREETIKAGQAGKRVTAFFGVPPLPGEEAEGWRLYVVMADDERSELWITSALFKQEQNYLSLTPECPAFHKFEREFYETTGIEPLGHPWLKPVRYDHNRFDARQIMENYPFYTMEGEEVHEVAVGPVHAGIIEPGHFRFMCHGERVHHLEIQLGYQHRGVEALLLPWRYPGRPSFNIHLAESIAGDTVIAHATAYIQAVEALARTEISLHAEVIRAVVLEMERIAVHIGDLGAIANDIAYMTGQAVCGATRTIVINTLLSICGSRFGRGMIRPGGTAFDFNAPLIEKIKTNLAEARRRVVQMAETMFSSPGVLARLEKTGTLSKETARSIGIVGMAARASGVSLDIRADHPTGAYKIFPVHKFCLESGDVFSRAYIRYLEILKSIDIIRDLLENIPAGPVITPVPPVLEKDLLVVSMVEGWRGQILHALLSNRAGEICWCKVIDPSFHNWYGLAQAVRENGVSDFPLVNKSFNLSYCGNDL